MIPFKYTCSQKKKDLAETYCVWHLHGVNVPLEVIVVGLHADDVIYDLIHLQKKKPNKQTKTPEKSVSCIAHDEFTH